MSACAMNGWLVETRAAVHDAGEARRRQRDCTRHTREAYLSASAAVSRSVGFTTSNESMNALATSDTCVQSFRKYCARHGGQREKA